MLKLLLKDSIVHVAFTKRDGSHRDMMCTLRDDLIGDKTYSRKPEPEDRITVWDVEKQAWRCFTLASVKFYQRA